MSLVDLFIRRLALPTVDCAPHFALECSRDVVSTVLHFLNPQVGHVRPTVLRKFFGKSYFVFLIDPTVDLLCFQIIRGERNVHKPTVHCYISI